MQYQYQRLRSSEITVNNVDKSNSYNSVSRLTSLFASIITEDTILVPTVPGLYLNDDVFTCAEWEMISNGNMKHFGTTLFFYPIHPLSLASKALKTFT